MKFIFKTTTPNSGVDNNCGMVIKNPACVARINNLKQNPDGSFSLSVGLYWFTSDANFVSGGKALDVVENLPTDLFKDYSSLELDSINDGEEGFFANMLNSVKDLILTADKINTATLLT
jgi:hypothetical protein